MLASGVAHYTASEFWPLLSCKAGLMSLTKTLALEITDVRVNAVKAN